MKPRKYIPTGPLRPFIKSYMIVESETGMENAIIPDTSLVIAFRLKGVVFDKAQPGDHLLPNLVFSGLRNQPRIIAYAQNSATFLVNFTEGGAAAFFNIPLHILFGQNIPLENFVPGSELIEISESLHDATSDIQRLRLVERFFLKRMNEKNIDPLIGASVRMLKQENGNIRISQLAKILCISKDPFEKRFRKSIGTSPKQFANIIRLRNCIATYDPNKALTDIALETGYYDQSHFIRDFKLFTGQTPLHFFRGLQYK